MGITSSGYTVVWSIVRPPPFWPTRWPLYSLSYRKSFLGHYTPINAYRFVMPWQRTRRLFLNIAFHALRPPVPDATASIPVRSPTAFAGFPSRSARLNAPPPPHGPTSWPTSIAVGSLAGLTAFLPQRAVPLAREIPSCTPLGGVVAWLTSFSKFRESWRPLFSAYLNALNGIVIFIRRLEPARRLDKLEYSPPVARPTVAAIRDCPTRNAGSRSSWECRGPTAGCH